MPLIIGYDNEYNVRRVITTASQQMPPKSEAVIWAKIHLLVNCTAVCRRRVKALGSMFPNRDRIASLAPSSILEFINMLRLDESL